MPCWDSQTPGFGRMGSWGPKAPRLSAGMLEALSNYILGRWISSNQAGWVFACQTSIRLWEEGSAAHLSGEKTEVQERPTRGLCSLGPCPFPFVSLPHLPEATEPLCPKWWRDRRWALLLEPRVPVSP